jgi:hypothetical protein
MSQSARVIADSVSPQGIRLISVQARYPKFIHGEAKTHRVMSVGDRAYELLEEVGVMDERVFSRNASSSRAIPVSRMIQDVIDDPVMPIYWGKNQPGMQATVEMTGGEREAVIAKWLKARDDAVANARLLAGSNVHKQLVNRVIEPWAHINVLITSTEWANFFALRRHSAAQPEMRALADSIHEAIEVSTPRLLRPHQWHLPYVTETDWEPCAKIANFSAEQGNLLIKLSVARCARLSYLTHDGRSPNVEEDLALYDRLVGSEPLHASPAEHQATPDDLTNIKLDMYVPSEEDMAQRKMSMSMTANWANPAEHGNLVGWRQYRKMLPNESVSDR